MFLDFCIKKSRLHGGDDCKEVCSVSSRLFVECQSETESRRVSHICSAVKPGLLLALGALILPTHGLSSRFAASTLLTLLLLTYAGFSRQSCGKR